jgi:hypothetical protein
VWIKLPRLFAVVSGIWLAAAQPPKIPKIWDNDALDTMELPLPDPAVKKRHPPSDYYYSAAVQTIYKNYPVYAPGREPAGYIEFLKQQTPEVLWDDAGHAPALDTATHLVRAGELVFNAPVAYGQGNNLGFTVEDLRDARWYAATGMPVAADGTVPFTRYVVREKGKIEIGRLACGMCHTRVMPNGTVIKGAQGNFPFGQWVAFNIARSPQSREKIRNDLLAVAGAPFLHPDPLEPLEGIDDVRLAALFAALPPGVIARNGTNLLYPVQVPDLIGLKDRRYFDHTGLEQHRGVADLMRYAAINQGMDLFESFGGFIPLGGPSHDTLPPIGTTINRRSIQRYSDAQLYALAYYLYSLRPPASPNPFDEKAARGKTVFKRERCGRCHTPPLYTNNALTPAAGFKVPAGHCQKYNIMDEVVGTDSGLTTKTRRGTGYYKVPSLRGVWRRGPLEHSGSVASLEDWFDPRRLRDDFVPTGFRGAGVQTRAVKGHAFGLGLSPDDKAALIAFLRTL